MLRKSRSWQTHKSEAEVVISVSPLCQHPVGQALLASVCPSEQDWPVAPQLAASATHVHA